MKKFVLLFVLILGICSVSLAASEEVDVLLNKRLQVYYDGELRAFQNAKGEDVYPISYEGTTYLPVRAISSLFETEIAWDGDTKTVTLGDGELDTNAARTIETFVAGESVDAKALRNEDVTIVYYGEEQTFADANGKRVYPLTYEGTTYLPVRAVSGLFGLLIDYDAENYAVIIASDEMYASVRIGNKVYSDDEISSYIDDNGVTIYYYYVDDGTPYYYFYDEDDNFISYYFDENGEIVFLGGEEINDQSFIDENGKEVYYFFDDEGNAYYYYEDENGELIYYSYDENGEIYYY